MSKPVPDLEAEADLIALDRKREACAGEIFVQIVSYRDMECQWTVKDLFEKAERPERVQVGIVWQIDRETDGACFDEPSPRPGQTRQVLFDAKDGQGVCWARHLCQQLWRGEEFTLQIDAHMRFVPGWDEKLIAELARCPSEKPVLSCNPAAYWPPDTLSTTPACTIRKVGQFDAAGDLRCNAAVLNKKPEAPLNGLFIAAGFVFARSAVIEEVPYDPKLYFNQEEISMAVRLYTHGWDVFSASDTFLYHYYFDDSQGGNRPLHWRDVKKAGDYQRWAAQRFNQLTGYGPATAPEALQDIDAYGLGYERSLDAFERASGVDFRNKQVSARALRALFIDGLERYRTEPMMLPGLDVPQGAGDAERKSALERVPLTHPTVFVQIASYRDPECQWTVKDLFEKAARPERVFVGICWQCDAEEDAHCFEVPAPRPNQVRTVDFDFRDSEGVCWARHQAQTLYGGEDYVLMIDSHMRFVEGWDEKMIADLLACGSEKPVISCHPAGYTPPDTLAENPRPTVLRAHPFNADGDFRCRGDFLDEWPEEPLPGAFLAAGYVFAPGRVVEEVPYDPAMYFAQEEITLAARLFTHGWDLFSSPRVLIYHNYNKPAETAAGRPLHWSDHEGWGRRQALGRKRMDVLLAGAETDDAEVKRDLDRFGLGTVRTIADYEAHAGLDFKTRTVHARGLRCGFIPELASYKHRPIHIPELDGKSAKDRTKKAEATIDLGAAPGGDVTPPPGAQPPDAPLEAPDDSQAPEASAQPEAARDADAQGRALRPIGPGEFVPFFELPDQKGIRREIQNYSVRPVAILYLPIENRAYLKEFYKALLSHGARMGEHDFHRVYVLRGKPDAVRDVEPDLGPDRLLWCDGDGLLARVLGIEETCRERAHAVVTDPNLKVVAVRNDDTADALLRGVTDDVIGYRAALPAAPVVLTRQAPIILVQNAVPADLRRRLIDYWSRNDKKYLGSIGVEGGVRVDDKAKRRTDADLHDTQLLGDVDQALSKSAFPEIRKVSGWEVTFRERYKIGRYTAEESGFYTTHRDTGVPDLAYRRYSMSVCLSDDYEGGTLEFVEYPGVCYRLEAGTAALFPSSLMHKVNPVTAGERFVMLSFLYGDAERAWHEGFVEREGRRGAGTEQAITCDIRFPGIDGGWVFTQRSPDET